MELAPSGPKKVSPQPAGKKSLSQKLNYIIYLYTCRCSHRNQFRSHFILYSTLWFLGRLLEWRGEVRQHCQFREGQQRHLRTPEQNLHRHNHPGESAVMWGKLETEICVRMGRGAETERMKGCLTFYFNWNYAFLKVQKRFSSSDHITNPPSLPPCPLSILRVVLMPVRNDNLQI